MITENSGVPEIASTVYEEVKKVKVMPKVNIIVTGKTGVGKSTMINAIFGSRMTDTGIGKPVTDNIQMLSDDRIPVKIYDTVGLELDAGKQVKSTDDICGLIEKKRETGKGEEYIHAVWYCVNSGSKRFEDFEADFVRELKSKYRVPVFVILTQCYAKKKAAELANYIEEATAIKPTAILAEDYETDAGIIPAYGLDALIEKTTASIPELMRDSLITAQRINLELKIDLAKKIVAQTQVAAAAAGFAPVPGVSDALLIIPAQISMIARITKVFGFPFDKAAVTAIVGSFVGTSGATVAGRAIVSNLLKCIPGVGTIAGGAISAATAAALTGVMGSAYIAAVRAMYETLSDGDFENSGLIAKTLADNIKIVMSKADIK
ncbi:GTPase [Synergistales bacterium]|nr:GTPase [Synergistales bacterium]